MAFPLASVGVALAALAAPTLAQTEQKLRASDGIAGDEFGRSVAVKDDLLLVGSRRAAYLYSLSTGSELQRFVPTGLLNTEAFGASVAFSDTLVVVGSPIGFIFSSDVGAVYVFSRSTGAQLRRIETALDSRDRFGTAVAVNDKWLVVGDPDVRPWTGNVHLYSATNFNLLEVISPGGIPGANFELGRSLALDGDRLAAGLWVGQTGGAVMLIDLPSGPRRNILSPPGDPYDHFGEDLALEGDRLLVGAPWSPWDQPAPTRPGVAYVFDWDTLAHVDTLTPTSSTAGDRFGRHVAIDGETYVMSGTRTGKDTVFAFDGGNFVDTLRLTASDGATGDDYSPIAANAARRVVGAPGDDDLGTDSGSVYVYSCAPADADCDCDGLTDTAEIDCNNDGTPDDCEDDFDGDGEPDDCQAIGPYCVAMPCPCGNDDTTGTDRGCANSTGSGAQLQSNGSASVSADALVLTANGLPSTTPLLLFVADSTSTSLTIGDGVTCTGGLSFRYAVAASGAQGDAFFSSVISSAPPGYMVPGLSRGFQVFYQDVGSPCATGVNLTNGVRILLTP